MLGQITVSVKPGSAQWRIALWRRSLGIGDTVRDPDERLRMERCARCAGGFVTELPCYVCWDGKADAEFVELLVEAAGGEDRTVGGHALRLLQAIDDDRATPALRIATSNGSPAVRAATAKSLGWSGDSRDLGIVASLLGDPEPVVRAAARSALANLGGRDAVDALHDSLQATTTEEEREDTYAALAWLGDSREIDAIRAQAVARIHQSRWSHRPRYMQSEGAIYALLRIGTEADRKLLVDEVVEMMATAEILDPEKPNYSPEVNLAQGAETKLRIELQRAGLDAEADQLRETFFEARRDRLPANTRPTLVNEVRCEPVLARTVARLTMRSLRTDRPPVGERPTAKFGGQPDWSGTPCWPLNPDGDPMVFYGQLPMIDAPERTAYIFFDLTGEGESFEYLGDGNAVVIQPGAAPHVPTREAATGPGLFERVPQKERYSPAEIHRPYERFIELEAGFDPPVWTWPELPEGSYRAAEEDAWCKLGGTPQFLQGEGQPPGDGWRFAFQFSAAWAGQELADGAECYGFVNDDGRGAIGWDCH